MISDFPRLLQRECRLRKKVVNINFRIGCHMFKVQFSKFSPQKVDELMRVKHEKRRTMMVLDGVT